MAKDIRLIILHNYFSSFATHVIGEEFRTIRHGNNVLNVLYKTARCSIFILHDGRMAKLKQTPCAFSLKFTHA